MKPDIYTKIILTIISICLILITLKYFNVFSDSNQVIDIYHHRSSSSKSSFGKSSFGKSSFGKSSFGKSSFD